MVEGLTVILPTFNSAPVIGAALASLPREVPVILSDNASSDDLAGAMRAVRPDARILRAARNEGFAAACNRGLRACDTPFAAIVNPDAALAPDCLELCVAALERAPDLALVTGEAAARGVAPGAVRLAPELNGSMLVMRRAALAPLGYYDESFFLYFEDTDLYLRARQAGWRLGFVGGADYDHVGGGSSVGLGAGRLERERLWGMGCAHFAALHPETPEGAKARRKLVRYRLKRIVAALTGARDKAALYAARLRGAAQRRREGPGCMRDTAFRR